MRARALSLPAQVDDGVRAPGVAGSIRRRTGPSLELTQRLAQPVG